MWTDSEDRDNTYILYYRKFVPVVRLGWLAPARQLPISNVLGECLAFLASGSDPTI